MFHFCHEEMLALLSFLGVSPYLALRVRSFFHRRKVCDHDHKEHL